MESQITLIRWGTPAVLEAIRDYLDDYYQSDDYRYKGGSFRLDGNFYEVSGDE